MPSVQYLREFINERLTAAAAEIFSEFEKTIVQYEEEIDRQRRLLHIAWKPEIKLRRTDIPQQHVCKEEVVLTGQQLFNRERSSNLVQEEPEPPQITEEPCSQEGEQLDLKEETDTFFKVIVTYEESDHSEAEPDSEQLPSHSSPVAESQDQEGTKNLDLGATGNRNRSDSNNAEDSPMSVDQLNTDTGKKSSKCDGFPKGKRRKVLKKMSQAEQKSEQLPSHSSPVAESQDQEGTKKVDSGSNGNRNRSDTNDAEDSPMSVDQLNTDTGKKSSKCDGFSKGKRRKTFKKKSQMRMHHRIPAGEKLHTCKSCTKSFTIRSNLLRHMRTHTGEKLHSCQTCGKAFIQNSDLVIHMRIHTGERPYSCKTCGKSFSQSGHLMAHVRIHTGERPFSCRTCGKSFSQGSNLWSHMRSHTREKLHVCETCGTRCSDQYSLKLHNAIHTGKRPHSCQTCGKTFVTRSNLLRHMRTHTGEKPYVCETCGERFTLSTSLKSHKTIHTGEKPYLCKTCGKMFRQNHHLVFHMKTHKP
ncbi:zinc finger protein 2-like isoform X1 [Archocentrus centrarchus]|uniref:zinc finger protein 2-like isoform X1 n=1 Tax=Archocentrus centrarchus TaxID=63155 RepID=UPI0011E9ED89|nr:zinc finger protein 2-like isoform X1 [Archocentrus centrarchus]